MLLVLPPSETQARPPAGSGAPLDLESLAFPDLTDARRDVLHALVTTSTLPDACRRVDAPSGAVEQVRANIDVETAPTVAALRLFTGALYAGLDAATLGPDALGRAQSSVVILSSLLGALRPEDACPAYRLGICAHLEGLALELSRFWRGELGSVLDGAARGDLVVDVRSSSYTPLWRPGPDDADLWVLVRVAGSPYAAKRTRGLLVRHLVELVEAPCSPGELVAATAAAFTTAFTTALAAPERPGRPWVLDVRPPA